jgi:MFS family permease
MPNLKSNLWKYFIFAFTLRRNYIPILSIYFLTLPDTTANMIGIYTGIGYIVAFLLEIPSGYFADIFGHKRTLILSRILMLASTASFVFVQNFFGFALGSIFLSTALAFSSGTASAFFHETLAGLGREKEYTKLLGKIRGTVSLIAAFFIIALPFFTAIDIILPLVITLFIDVIGLIVTFSFITPKVHENIDGQKIKSIFKIFKEVRKLNFLPFILFTGSISGFIESLGYPIILIGFVMGLSRFVWFIVGRYSYLIEKHLTMKQHFLFEIILFSSYFFLAAFISHPYALSIVFIIGVGYMWGRTQVIESYILNNYVSDKRYKATILSIGGQISLFFKVAVSFLLGFLVSYSYSFGYLVLGIILLLLLSTSFISIKKSEVTV